MFEAFCSRAECDWIAPAPFADTLAAFDAVGQHLVDDHGATIRGLIPTQFAGMARVDTGELHSRAYVRELNTLADAYAVA